MSLTICWWVALLALLQGVIAQTTGTINLFTSNGCTGSHMSCGNIPANGCCTTGGAVVASVFLVTFQNQASVGIHSNAGCKGVSRKANSLSCFQPSFAFAAANWATASAGLLRRDETVNSITEDKHCRRPDSITIIDDNGEETQVTIPEGENTEYENAFVKGDYATLMHLAKVKRRLRFSR